MAFVYFKRKSGYMSPYKLRQLLQIVATYPRRGLPLDAVYTRIGSRFIKLWKGTK